MGLFGGGGFSLGGVSLGGGFLNGTGTYGDLMNAGNGISGGGGWTDLIPGVGDANAINRANEANVALNEKQMRFQERMSNTAYQRAMLDMKKAGLNPMLAFQQGGASVPNGASANIQAASKTGLANTALSAFTGIQNSRNQTAQTNANIAQAESTIKLQDTQSAKNMADTQRQIVDTQREKSRLPREQLNEKLYNRGTNILERVLETSANGAKQLEKVITPGWKNHENSEWDFKNNKIVPRKH